MGGLLLLLLLRAPVFEAYSPEPPSVGVPH